MPFSLSPSDSSSQVLTSPEETAPHQQSGDWESREGGAGARAEEGDQGKTGPGNAGTPGEAPPTKASPAPPGGPLEALPL